MSDRSWAIAGRDWAPGDSGPLHVSVLFMDMVSSTDVAGVLGLEEYAELARSFEAICRKQLQYLFEDRGAERYADDGRHWGFEVTGDELVVFLHTDRPHDDIYQLVCLAIALKCAWLSSPMNTQCIESGRATMELAAGIHSGLVWATRRTGGFEKRGLAINLAKRIESASREGDRFRIFVSDAAFKLVQGRMRNLLFGERGLHRAKGIHGEVGIHELRESFVEPTRRMHPDLAKGFADRARRALATNTFDLWIHSCLQLEERLAEILPDDERVVLARRVLAIDPKNPVALMVLSDACNDSGDNETALLYLGDLVAHWPSFGDGWLALARTFRQQGDEDEARRALLQAYRFGVPRDEEPLEPPALGADDEVEADDVGDAD